MTSNNGQGSCKTGNATAMLQQQCQPCLQARLECTWDSDRRTRRKVLSKQADGATAAVQNPNTETATLDDLATIAVQPPSQTQSAAPPPDQLPEQPPGQSPPESPPESPSEIHLPLSRRLTNYEAPLPTAVHNVLDLRTDNPDTCSNGMPALLGPADGGHMNLSESYMRPPEEGQNGGLELNQDCFDFQDFVLDWSNFHPVSGEMPIFTLQPNSVADDSLKAGRSRSIKIRYYRTFGPTALFPG
ncbi:hypothetical protein FPRO04_14300, partial [Fusarium proliferatum]